MVITCPYCKQSIEIDETLNVNKCSFCGAIIESKFFEEDESYHDMYSQAVSFLEKKQFDLLLDLTNAMLKRWPFNFYSNLFYLCAKTQLDLTKPLPYITYKLSSEEMEEDLKARIYYFARIKYQKSSQTIYNAISSYYPDVADKNSDTGWSKTKTSFDCKLENINMYLTKLNLVAQNISNLKTYAKKDSQISIIEKIYKWGDYLLKAKKELLRYDDYASTLVKNDFDNTPNPGHLPYASLYMGLFIFSLILLLVTLVEIVIGFSLGNFYNLFSQIGSIFISAYMITMVIYFTIKLKLFSLGRHPIIGCTLYGFTIALSIVGITSCFINNTSMNNLIITYFFLTLIALIYSSTTAIIKWNKYRSRKNKKSSTYIGNLQALERNNFIIDFDFKFEDIKKE